MQSHAQPKMRPKQGKIKAPKRAEMDTVVLWERLSESIREIHNKKAHFLSFEENYRFAYNMVLYRKGDELYKGVTKLVAENLDRLAEEVIVPTFVTSIGTNSSKAGGNSALQEGVDRLRRGEEGTALLKSLKSVRDEHVGNMEKLKGLLAYMDRVHTKAARVPVIFEAGMQLFLEHIIHSKRWPIRQNITDTLLDQIQLERDGHAINRSAVKGCVDVLIELRDIKEPDIKNTVYKLDFEPLFLERSRNFYEEEGVTLIGSSDPTEYLQKVEARFDQETSRTQYYLSSFTEAPLLDILKDHLITPHVETIVSRGLDGMIDSDKIDSLARMYRLFVMVPSGLPVLKKAMKEAIIRRGKEINATDVGADGEGGDGEDEGDGNADLLTDIKGKGRESLVPKRKGTAGKGGANNGGKPVEVAIQWVQNVLDLKDRFDKLLRDAFADDIALQTAFTEAFKRFINNNKKAPEFISLFIDENLKKGLKGKSDDEVDVILDKTITVFQFIEERDVFERYYKTHLAKRLLQQRSVSDDAERGMLAKLKIECGYQFTQKLEGMFNDIKISNDHMNGYREYLIKTGQNPEVPISVNVLTSTFWPMSLAPQPCTIPLQMTAACSSYERYYLSRHSGRRLTWQPSLGSADVRVTFKAKTHDLNVSTFSLVILLLFEPVAEGDILTYEEIHKATGMNEDELKRHLQSLACAKFKVLKKHPPGRDVLSDDSFSFNHDFTSPMQRIKISTIAAKVESTEQRRETMEKVDEERKHQIDACIVRTMKDRKVLPHNELINEVTRQLASRFQPSPLQIKKRIEALIEREYLERGEDKKSYVYQA